MANSAKRLLFGNSTNVSFFLNKAVKNLVTNTFTSRRYEIMKMKGKNVPTVRLLEGLQVPFEKYKSIRQNESKENRNRRRSLLPDAICDTLIDISSPSILDLRTKDELHHKLLRYERANSEPDIANLGIDPASAWLNPRMFRRRSAYGWHFGKLSKFEAKTNNIAAWKSECDDETTSKGPSRNQKSSKRRAAPSQSSRNLEKHWTQRQIVQASAISNNIVVDRRDHCSERASPRESKKSYSINLIFVVHRRSFYK